MIMHQMPNEAGGCCLRADSVCLLKISHYISVVMFVEGRVGFVCRSGLWRSRHTDYSQSLWACRVASKLVRQVGRQIQAQPQSLLHTLYTHTCLQFSVVICDARDTCLECFFLCRSCISVCCSNVFVAVFAA